MSIQQEEFWVNTLGRPPTSQGTEIRWEDKEAGSARHVLSLERSAASEGAMTGARGKGSQRGGKSQGYHPNYLKETLGTPAKVTT